MKITTTVNPCEQYDTCVMSELCPGFLDCLIAEENYNKDNDNGESW
jgi:hypothetical protein